jgi:glycosyltransferase involved in cell wall biosynthesis
MQNGSMQNLSNPMVAMIDSAFSEKDLNDAPSIKRLQKSLIPVVHLVENFDAGGLERFVLDLTVAQTSLGQNAIIIYTSNGGSMQMEAEQSGLQIMKIETEHEFNDFIELSGVTTCFVHHSYRILSDRILEAVNVVEVIHNPYWWQRGNLELARLRLKMHKIICVSEYVRNYVIDFLDIDSHKAIVIENSISFDSTPTISESKKRVLLSVGNFAPQKNQLLLMLAFNRFQNRNPELNTELWIVGRNVESNLSKYIDRGIEFPKLENIKLFSAQSKEEMNKVYEDSDYFILPSTYEGFSLASLEALHFGLPIALSRCGGFSEIEKATNNLVLIPEITPDGERLTHTYIEKTCWEPSQEQITATAEAIEKLILLEKNYTPLDFFTFEEMVSKYMAIDANL